MTQLQFLLALHDKLKALPKEDVEERLAFYHEMIEDRMEEGLSEEEAVAAIGTVDEIAAQIAGDIPLISIAKDKLKLKRQLKAWEIVLLALGAPIWLSLVIAAFAVIFSVYVSVWAVIVSLWSVFGSLAGCVLGGLVSGICFMVTGNVHVGIAVFGAGILCAGLSIFMFYGCLAATKGTVILTKKVAIAVKKCFIKKEEA